MNLKFGIIIVTYNSSDFITNCINSILVQKYIDYKITIIDNNSQDNTKELLKNIVNLNLEKINIIFMEKNLGFASGNNFAANKLTNVDYLILINPDTEMENNFLEKLNQNIKDNFDYKYFACRMMKMGYDNVIDGAGDEYHISGLCWRIGYNKNLSQDFLYNREVFSPCGGAAIYNYELFQKFHGFDETFFCYIEDVELGLRLNNNGYKCLYLHDVTINHKGGHSTINNSSFSIYFIYKNILKCYYKNIYHNVNILFKLYHYITFSISYFRNYLINKNYKLSLFKKILLDFRFEKNNLSIYHGKISNNISRKFFLNK